MAGRWLAALVLLAASSSAWHAARRIVFLHSHNSKLICHAARQPRLHELQRFTHCFVDGTRAHHRGSRGSERAKARVAPPTQVGASKIVPLAIMFFAILFNYTILRTLKTCWL